jgi:tetratricopeptide (TPR) repeat protein
VARSLTLLLFLIGLPSTLFAQFPDRHQAQIDTLLFWRDASRPDVVDSLAGPAIATARAENDSAGLTTFLLVRGATRAGFGMALKAEEDLREGITLATALGDTFHHLRFLRWLGVAVGRQGRGREAAALFRDLEKMARAADDSLHLGWAWVGIAYDYYLNGRTVAAGETYALAADVLQSRGETAGAVWAWNGRGLALRQAGRYREARQAFGRVLALVEGTGDVVNEATALDQIGRLEMMLGDPGRAVEYFQRSVELNRQHRHHREGLVPSVDLAKAWISQGRFGPAEALLDSALTECRRLGLRDLEVFTETKLVDAALDQGRPGAAAARCRRVLASGQMPSRLAETEVRLGLAMALADKDSLAAAAAVLEGILEGGAGAVSLELRTAALLGELLVDRGLAAEGVVILRQAERLARESGHEAESVLLLTQLGRAEVVLGRPTAALTVFEEAMATWERIRAYPADPVWREHRGTLAGSLFANAAAARLETPDGLNKAWAWSQRHKARTLRERMLGPGAEPAPPPPADLAHFRQTVLRPGEVLLDLVEGDRLSVLFCVARDTVLVARIPGRRDIGPALRRLNEVVRSATVDDPAVARRLARRLIASWPGEVRRLAASAHTVWWCPDGSWHRFPPALLDWRAVLARIPAAGVLERIRAVKRPAAPAGDILVVAGPDPETGGPLPGAAGETAWLAARFRDVRTDNLPGEAIPGTLPGADILHLAAHTLLDENQPWQTGIHLGAAPERILRAEEVADLSLEARLAVLAGCTTAGSRIVGGEGLIGLAGAFLAARTPTVLATLWPVDDGVAYRVMTSFYDGLADGLTTGAALSRARAACLSDPLTAAPRHWAAFVLVGEGDVTVPIRRRTPRWPWAVILLLLAVAAAARARR